MIVQQKFRNNTLRMRMTPLPEEMGRTALVTVDMYANEVPGGQQYDYTCLTQWHKCCRNGI
jgi:hypothetical protein